MLINGCVISQSTNILFYKELGLSLDNIRLLLNLHNFFRPLAQSGVIDTKSIVEKVTKIMNIVWEKLLARSEEVNDKFHKAMKDGPDSLDAKTAVIAFREFVNMLIPCEDPYAKKNRTGLFG